jgi:hypothetical protein
MHHGLGLELEGTIAVVDSLSKSAAESQRILNKMERYLWQQQMIRQATAELSRERSDGHVEVFIRWKSLHTELELEMRQRMVLLNKKLNSYEKLIHIK